MCGSLSVRPRAQILKCPNSVLLHRRYVSAYKSGENVQVVDIFDRFHLFCFNATGFAYDK